MNNSVAMNTLNYSRPSDITVTDLTRMIKQLIETNIPMVAVIGELSNYVHHSSGHRYFTLKDETSQLRCVMFKWQGGRLDFKPEEGMKLRVVGNVTVYERGGQYQLNVVSISPLGRGELLARLEELKKKLDAEGVFVQARPIPEYPVTIGVITSPTGAAVRDIISVIRRRAPYVRIILRPTQVQGAGAASDIVDAVTEINNHTDADVLIVGRGGGSIEDLWCFNEEIVARAIASSGIPVISAVGHETDVTLADFAADLRAPTPSAAAELAVRDVRELFQELEGYRSYLRQNRINRVDELARRVEQARRGLSAERFFQGLQLRSQSVDELFFRMQNAQLHSLSEKEKALERISGKMQALNPRSVLERGFAIVTRESDNIVVTDSSMVNTDERIALEFARGRLRARVNDILN